MPLNLSLLLSDLNSIIYSRNSGDKTIDLIIHGINDLYVEIERLSAKPSHRIVAACLEYNIAWNIISALSQKKDWKNLVIFMSQTNALNQPIARALTKQDYNEFEETIKTKNKSGILEVESMRYISFNLDTATSLLKSTLEGSLGKKLCGSVAYQCSHSYGQYRLFYATALWPEVFPKEILNLSDRMIGIHYTKNKTSIKNIRKILQEELDSGQAPHNLDFNKQLNKIMTGMTWVKPCDGEFAAALQSGSRSLNWIEQFIQTESLLRILTTGLDKKTIHKKYCSQYSNLITDICMSSVFIENELCINAMEHLINSLAKSSCLTSSAIHETITKIYDFYSSDRISVDKLNYPLPLKLIGLYLGLENQAEVSSFIKAENLDRKATKIISEMYSDGIEAAKVTDGLKLHSYNSKLNRMKARSLEESLGL